MQVETNKWMELLRALIQQVPSLLTLTACVIFAITRAKWFPKVSRILAIGLALLLVNEILFTLVYIWVPGWFLNPDAYNADRTRAVYLVLGLITSTMFALSMAPFLVAIFMKRDQAPD